MTFFRKRSSSMNGNLLILVWWASNLGKFSLLSDLNRLGFGTSQAFLNCIQIFVQISSMFKDIHHYICLFFILFGKNKHHSKFLFQKLPKKSLFLEVLLTKQIKICVIKSSFCLSFWKITFLLFPFVIEKNC